MNAFLSNLIGVLALFCIHATVNTAAPDTAGESFVLPTAHFDIATANVWKCTHSIGSPLSSNDLHNNGYLYQIEVLQSRTQPDSNLVEIVTPIDSVHDLESLGLTYCTHLARMRDLISTELLGSWANLQHHIDHSHPLLDSIREQTELKELGDKESKIEHNILKRSPSEEMSQKSEGGSKCGEDVCRKEKVESFERDKTIEEWFSQYHNLSAIYRWYLKLANDHPDTVTLNKTIGKSYYEREIIALHITENGDKEKKPKIYLQCLLHSREWITGSVCMYLSYRLAAPHPSDTTLLKLLKEVEFVIVPIANPDGYYATWLEYPKYRLWRKNVQPLNGSECAGVDLNRNFDTHWEADTFSRSDDPCSELYHGPGAGSELEVQIITAYIRSLGKVIGAVDFHSYHQEVLYPPAFSGENAGNLESIQHVAESVAVAASQDGQSYTPHKMFDIYSAAGTFADWLLDYRNDAHYPDSDDLIPLTIELRPKATNDTTYVGFLLPTTEILPSCQEMLSAFVTFSELVLEEQRKQ